jgi:signal transduction histidine kinase
MTTRPKGRSLRTRMTLAVLLLGAFSSALFAFGIFIAAERFERSVLAKHIEAEFQTLVAAARSDPALDTTQSALLKAYVGRDNPALPPELAELDDGTYHAVHFNDRSYQVLVGDDNGRRFYVAYDITEWEALERPVIYVLIAGVLLSTLLAVWIGFRSSAQVIAPVTRLTARLKSLDPRQRRVRLAGEFEGAEVATIADAFDRYMERLDGFVEREQLFTSAAAHELRTPLAVLQGSAEVLLEQPELSPRARRAGERISRATREMREFIEALLVISREQRVEIEPSSTKLSKIVADVVRDHTFLADRDCIDIGVAVESEIELAVPPALPTMVISNLLRNALEHTDHGRIDVRLENRTLTVSDTGAGIAAEDIGRVFDRGYSTKSSGGMGLHLAKRICEQLGWDLRIESALGTGTKARLTF